MQPRKLNNYSNKTSTQTGNNNIQYGGGQELG